MMWNSPIEKPVEGDLKAITKFAWLPKQVGDKKVWLEGYQQLWEYRYANRAPKWMNQPPTLDWDLIGEKHMRGLPKMYNPPPPPNSTEREKKQWGVFVKEQMKESFL